MVAGIETFKEKFKDYTDCYTVIGGTACDILMAEADIDFRATKDIDMILLMEERSKSFAKVFWEYIKEGRYKCGWKNSDETHFYRFTEPEPGYPVMIELFSRRPDYKLNVDEGIIPVHIDDDISSLSAILLNDDFYSFMLSGRKVVSDVAVLGAEYLIPFKMYAWLDLNKRKNSGEHVNSRDLKKHKNDVFRLLQIVRTGSSIQSSGLVKSSIIEFINTIKSEEIDAFQMNLPYSKEEAIKILQGIYIG